MIDGQIEVTTRPRHPGVLRFSVVYCVWAALVSPALGDLVIPFERLAAISSLADVTGVPASMGSNRHERVNDLGSLELVGIPTPSLSSFDGFFPQSGSDFETLTWQTDLIGEMCQKPFDSFLLGAGIRFERALVNPSGSGSLALRADTLPESRGSRAWPSILVANSAAFAVRRRRRDDEFSSDPQLPGEASV